MFHRLVLNGFVLLILLISGCGGSLGNPDSLQAELLSDSEFLEIKGEVESIVSQIEDKYSVRVYYKNCPWFSWFSYKYTIAPKSNYGKLVDYLSVLQEELDKYQEGFLRKCGIKSIVVCKDLSSSGISAGGYANSDNNVIYCVYISGSSMYSKKTIHHEIYHMMEAKFNGGAYFEDRQWSKLNSKDFKYGKGGKYFRRTNSPSMKNFHPRPGFITDYATSGLKEDRAEVYAGLFVEEISSCLHEWIVEDEILRNKVNYMKDFLLECSDDMTSEYFADLCSGECLPLEKTWGHLYDKHDSRFSGELAGETVAELIAITEVSGDCGKWWKPNGEIFDEAPFVLEEPERNIDGESKLYRFFFYAKKGTLPFGHNSTNLPGGRICHFCSPASDKDDRLFVNVWSVTGVFDQPRETVQLKSGVCLGEWNMKATYDPRTKATICSDRSVRFDKLRKKNGRFTIDVFDSNLDYQNTAMRIVAVDDAGKINHGIITQIDFWEDEMKCSSNFVFLAGGEIKEIQYSVIPYTWVSFENISLRPGQITEVQVKIENN